MSTLNSVLDQLEMKMSLVCFKNVFYLIKLFLNGIFANEHFRIYKIIVWTKKFTFWSLVLENNYK